MSLKTKVKAGNITSLSDARYCSGMGVDILGFPLSQGDWDTGLARLNDIRGWVPGPLLALEWSETEGLPSQPLPSYIDLLQINAALLRDTEMDVNIIAAIDLNLIPQYFDQISKNRARISYLLISAHKLDADAQTKVNAIAKEYPVLLDIGPTSDNLSIALTLNITGFALNGSPESAPGLKEYSSLSEILEALDDD